MTPCTTKTLSKDSEKSPNSIYMGSRKRGDFYTYSRLINICPDFLAASYCAREFMQHGEQIHTGESVSRIAFNEADRRWYVWSNIRCSTLSEYKAVRARAIDYYETVLEEDF